MNTQAILEMIVNDAALEERIVRGSQPCKRVARPPDIAVAPPPGAPPILPFATPALQAERLALYRYLHRLTCM
jgi:hypothetical protein